VPVLPALGTGPEDEPGALGDVVVVPLEVPVPLAPAPAEPCRRRQSSRWVPVRPTHWLGVTVAPAAADPLVLPVLSLGPPVPPPGVPPLVTEVESSVLELPVPVPPAAALPLEEVPDDAPVEPEVPAPEPDDWANVTEESARSAAAVAAVIAFNIMG
jgi:hypothetical protein